MIIVIDDMEPIVEWMTALVREEGYYADFAFDANSALYKMSRIYYSLALIDIILPGDIRGDEIAEKVRAFPDPFCHIPMVAMTGGGDIKNVELFADVLRKPFLPRQLRDIIERIARPPIPDLHLTKITPIVSPDLVASLKKEP